MKTGLRSLLCVCGIVVTPLSSEAFELAGGVSLGGMLAGTKPRLAVSPHAGVLWRTDGGFLVAAQDVFSILPAADEHGIGAHNQASVLLGYASESFNVSVGPALSIYSMPMCNRASLCGRVVGLSPGGYALANLYFAGPLGVSVSASIDWIHGNSLVFSEGVAAMLVAGPVVRWTSR